MKGLPRWPKHWLERSQPPLDDRALREWIKEQIRADGGVTHRKMEAGDEVRIERRAVAAPDAHRVGHDPSLCAAIRTR